MNQKPKGKTEKLIAILLSTTLLLPLLFTSCATVGTQFDSTNIDNITVAKTTTEDVRAWFGAPYTRIDVPTWEYKRMHFGDEQAHTIWRYIYAKGTIASAQGKSLQVEFDKDGIVTDYYYSSDFGKDKTDEPKVKKDFNIFLAREKVLINRTTKAQVLSLLGNNYRVININKPNVYERWHYGYTGKSKHEKITAATSLGEVEIKKIYGKSLDIDFDINGVVVDIRGESDFPQDTDRFFAQ